MRLVKIAVATALAAGPVASVGLGGPASAASRAPFSPGAPIQLTWDRVPGIDTLKPLGPAPASAEMQIVVAIKDPNVAAEKAYLTAISTAGDPRFRHFLTPAQIGAQFGPAPAVTTDVVNRLRSAGLDVYRVAATGDTVSAVGSPAAVDRAFNVHEMSYRAGDGTTFIANQQGPTVMSGDQIGTVVGLDTRQKWQLPQMPSATQQAKDEAAMGAKAKAAGAGIGLTTTPMDLWNIYDQPSAVTGQGQQVAVIGEGDPTEPISNLKAFESKFNLPKVPVRTNCVEAAHFSPNPLPAPYSGGDCGKDTSGNGEWDIDFTASTGMAPNVGQLQLYFSQDLADPDLDNAFIAWVQDANAPRQASASEGVCEQTPLNGIWRGPLEPLNTNDNESMVPGLALGDDQEPVVESQLLHATIQGKTLFTSTGDTGFTCGAVILPVVTAGNGVIYNGAPSVEYPAASDYSVAVGGTVLYTDGGTPGSRLAEYGWSYGGGGSAQFIAAPPWQAGESHVVGRCLSDPNGNPSATGALCRGVPDVSAQSGDLLTGYDTGGGVGAGTSLAAPLWQGMWARIQSSNPDPSGFGFAAPLLYKLGDGATASNDFNDITVGDNGYPATPGWDYNTGFGTPNVAHIITDLTALEAGSGPGGGQVPEAPLAILVPVLALLVAGGLLYRRRRRLG